MGLQYYRDKMCEVVCAIAKSRTYNERLHAAWVQYLHRIDWVALEELLPDEDRKVLQQLKHCLCEEMQAEVEKNRRKILDQYGEPETEEESASFRSRFGYEYALKALAPLKAKRFIENIVDVYLVLVRRADFEVQSHLQRQRT